MSETWRPIPGFEGSYEVSDLGRVRSLDRTSTQMGRWGFLVHVRRRGQTLRPGIASHGYSTVSLSGASYCLHELVLHAFKGPRPFPEAVCRHLDGCKQHNVPANLVWGTRVENRKDADDAGASVRGEGYCTAKLTDNSAREIRRLKGIVSQSTLALHFGVSPAAVQAVHDRRTWKHV